MLDSVSLFVPGRVCLLGEHSDWAGGWRRVNPAILPGRALLVGTREGIHARVRRCPGQFRLRSTIAPGWLEIPFTRDALLDEARSGRLGAYAAGVAYQALVRHVVDGIEVDNVVTDLPVRRGLSSSAAICVLVARAFNWLYDLGLTLRDEMDLAFLGETTTPSRCGRLDQGCAFGRRAARMDFDGDDWGASPIPVGRAVHLVLVDLRASKDTRRILYDLNACYPFPRDEVHRRVHEALGARNLDLVARAEEALGRGDARTLGALMSEAQSVFDALVAPACPGELEAPVLHRVLSDPRLKDLSWGGKGVGSQGDGSAQLVARDAPCQQALLEAVRGMGLGGMAVDLEA